MKSNRIPRTFERIVATALFGEFKGHRFTITKDELGYHGRDEETGKDYSMFVSHLRNADLYHFEGIFTGA